MFIVQLIWKNDMQLLNSWIEMWYTQRNTIPMLLFYQQLVVTFIGQKQGCKHFRNRQATDKIKNK